VPKEVSFATKPRLAVQMIGRSIAANVPFAWVAADSVYGVGELETALRRADKGYVLGVNATQQFHSWSAKLSMSGTAEETAEGLGASAWPRLHDWAYLEPADLDAGKFYPGSDGLWARGLLSRRNLADGKLAYFATWCPAGTGADKRVQVEGCRRAIEDSFETAKTELGLDHNETRSWHGWHRHTSLVMLAFAMMASIRHRANQPAPSQTLGLTRFGGHPEAFARGVPDAQASSAVFT
jgi:SRSO17 transposase